MAYIGEGGVKQLAVLINNRYITADAVDTKISDAVKDIAGFKTEVVASLPTTGVEGTIYFAPSSNAEDGNSYDEFIWIASQTKFEQVGSTKVDLDDYAKTEDLYDPDNKDTLAKLSTSDDGTLLFDGSEIKGESNDIGTVYRKETVLWSGYINSESTLTLFDDYNKYDEILFVANSSSTESESEMQIVYNTVKVSELTADKIQNFLLVTFDYGPRQYNIQGHFSSDLKSVVLDKVNNSSLMKIVGYNYTTDVESLDNIEVVKKISESSDGNLLYDGKEISGGDTVEVTQTLTSGTEIGSIKVGDETTVLYAPESGSGGGTGDVYYAYEGYSEEEQVIGEYFGKPLYRKVIVDRTVGSSNATESISLTSLSISKMVNYDIFIEQGGVSKIPNGYRNSDNTIWFTASATPSVITTVRANAGHWAGSNYYIILEYTKTTDADNSFTPSMITDNKTIISAAPYFEDYSTEEKCIGRYVDGRPIYRRTWHITNITSLMGGNNYNLFDVVDIDLLMDSKLIAVYNQGEAVGDRFPISYSRITDNKFNVIMTGNVANITNIYVTLEYTKTTDAPNSFKPEMITSGIMAEAVTDSDIDDVFDLMEV